jgi:hypothetical protein
MPGIAYVGEAGIPGQNELGSAAIPYTSSGGTLILAGLFYDGGNSPCLLTGITDTAGNTWSFATSVSQSPPQAEEYDGGSQYITTFVAWCIGARPVTRITIGRSDTGSNWWRVTLAEFSDIGVLHSAASNSAASGTVPTATLAVSVGDLVIGSADALNGVPGMPSGWTPFTTSGSICNGYILGAPAGSYSPAWGLGTSDHWAVAVASFSPAGGTEQGAASFSAASVLTAGGRGIVLPAVHLAAGSALAAPAIRSATGMAALSSPSLLTSSARLTRHAAAPLAARSSLLAGAYRIVHGPAALAGASTLTAAVSAAGPDPGALWNLYQAAAMKASDAWRNWRMMRAVSGTDGTSGFLYGQAYEAQQAADAAYQAYVSAQERAFPGARG